MPTWTISGAIGTIDLGYVSTELVTKDASLQIMTMPTTDAYGTFAFDYYGVQGTIHIEGKKTFATKAEAQAYLGTTSYFTSDGGVPVTGTNTDTLHQLINGNQSVPMTYTSDLYGAMSVKVTTGTARISENNSYSFVDYTLDMVICTT